MIKKIKLYTNIEKISSQEEDHQEIEQKLTINSNGKIIFSSAFVGKVAQHYAKGRKEEIEIPEEVVKEIFEKIDNYFKEQPTYNVIPSFGMWELSILESGNKKRRYYGVTSGVYNDLTQFIQRRIPIDHLMVFM